MRTWVFSWNCKCLLSTNRTTHAFRSSTLDRPPELSSIRYSRCRCWLARRCVDNISPPQKVHLSDSLPSERVRHLSPHHPVKRGISSCLQILTEKVTFATQIRCTFVLPTEWSPRSGLCPYGLCTTNLGLRYWGHGPDPMQVPWVWSQSECFPFHFCARRT